MPRQSAAVSTSLVVDDAGFLGQILAELGTAITVRNLAGEIVYANPAALAMCGCSSLADLQARGTEAILDDYVAETSDGVPLVHGEIPSMRLLRGEAVEPMLLRTVHRETGEERWWLLRTAPLRGADATVVGAVTAIEDVTAVKLAELRTEILAESGRWLVSSLDYAQTLWPDPVHRSTCCESWWVVGTCRVGLPPASTGADA